MSSGKPRFEGRRVKLGEVCEQSKRKNRDGACGSVYSVTNSRGFVPSEDYFSKEVYSKELRTYRIVGRNMIAYNPSRINVGSVALQNKEDEVVVSPLYVVFSVDDKRLLPNYLVRFLKSKPGLEQIRFRSTGTVRNSLKYDALCLIDMNLPSVDEQYARLKRLVQVERLIALREHQLSKLDELVKSRFLEMFGDPAKNPMEWGVASLADLGSCKNGMNFGKSECGVVLPCLGVSDFKDRAVIEGTDGLSKICLDELPKQDHYLKDGDIVFVRSNGNKKLVGRCLAVYPHDEKVVYSGFCIRLRLESDVVRVPFLVWSLKQPSIRSKMFGRGANVQNLNQKILAAIKVPVPPLELQDEFLSFVAQVDKSGFAARQSIEKLQTLYDSLAQEYFG